MTFTLTAGVAVSIAASAHSSNTLKISGGRAVHYDEFGDVHAQGCLVVLHGASGPAAPLPWAQAEFFANHGFHVFLPQYFNATHSTAPDFGNYGAWADVAGDFVSLCHKEPATRRVFLLGFSLGASVALVAGSEGEAVDGVADWYGSLPDDFFYRMKTMSPLLVLHGERDTNIPVINGRQLVQLCQAKQLPCESHFYPDQGHGFSGSSLEDADRRTLAFFADRSLPTNHNAAQP